MTQGKQDLQNLVTLTLAEQKLNAALCHPQLFTASTPSHASLDAAALHDYIVCKFNLSSGKYYYIT